MLVLLPCSVFKPGGFLPPGTTAIERRTIASTVPVWKDSACTQCNICAFVCPHAAIRPVLATPEELQSAPAGFSTLPIKGSKDLAGYQYRVQVSQHRQAHNSASCPVWMIQPLMQAVCSTRSCSGSVQLLLVWQQ